MLVFEFFLSIRASFLVAGAGRMPRRCAATAEVHGSVLISYPWVVNSGFQKNALKVQKILVYV